MEHYNAFISYKHAPEDNRVAEAVHKGLERFHIPKKIQKKTGIKRINRIFRDKDELPITSDLSDTISNALSDSDYLIVICSTNTKLSAWVPREIDCFLKNHSKRDIFTVLVNGEPIDVIPEVLRYDERTVKDENGNETVVRIPVEPLSCDYRMSPSKAKRIELPRLASGIIGCAYDELMNRRRQYRLKQAAALVLAAFLLMAGFSAYMFYSRDRIHKTYLESLKNQSIYLANESGNLLEKEQRITALQLALEALPKNPEDERPVTAQALRALCDATLAYESSQGSNIHAAWSYRMPGVISDFKLSPKGSTIAIRDDGNVIGVWDTKSHERRLYLEGEYPRLSGMKYLNETILALWSGKTVSAYDTETGTLLWDYTLDDKSYTSFDSEKCSMVTEDSFIISTIDNSLLTLDSRSGSLKSRVSMTGSEDDTDFNLDERLSMTECALSPDKNRLALCALKGWNSYVYGVFDLKSKELLLSDVIEETVKNIEWTSDDDFLISSINVDMKGSMSFGNRSVITYDHSTIRCINAHDLTEKWNSDFVCNGVMINSGFLRLKDSFAYYSGNVAIVYDLKTGKMLYSSNVNDSIIDISDRDGDGIPGFITKNGGYAQPAQNVDNDAVYYTPYFADDLRQAAVNSGVYVRQNLSHEVIFYGVNVYDEEWTPLSEDPKIPDLINGYCLEGDQLALLYAEDDLPRLSIFSLGEKTDRTDIELPGQKAYEYCLLGIENDTVYLGHDSDGGYELVSLSGKDGSLNKELLNKNILGSLREGVRIKGGRLLYCYTGEDYETILAVRDLSTSDTHLIKVPKEISYPKKAPVFFEETGTVYLTGEKDFIAGEGSAQAEEVETPEDWAGASCFSDNCPEGLFAVSDGNTILISDEKGKISSSIPCPGLTPIGMTFDEGDLLVLYNDGSLNRYSKDTGEFKKNIDILIFYNYTGDVSFEKDEKNGLLYVRLDNLTSVVDLKNGIEVANIQNCFGHHRDRDIFITSSKESGDRKKIGYFRHYSTEDLITKAKNILKGEELSDELKSRYGIE